MNNEWPKATGDRTAELVHRGVWGGGTLSLRQWQREVDTGGGCGNKHETHQLHLKAWNLYQNVRGGERKKHKSLRGNCSRQDQQKVRAPLGGRKGISISWSRVLGKLKHPEDHVRQDMGLPSRQARPAAARVPL